MSITNGFGEFIMSFSRFVYLILNFNLIFMAVHLILLLGKLSPPETTFRGNIISVTEYNSTWLLGIYEWLHLHHFQLHTLVFLKSSVPDDLMIQWIIFLCVALRILPAYVLWCKPDHSINFLTTFKGSNRW